MISILCPTRNRTANMRRLYESAMGLAQNPKEVEIVFYIDSDDTPSIDTARELKCPYVKGERIVLSEMWNKAYEIAKGDILMHSGDDLIFRTQNWDSLVEAEFGKYTDKIVFVYGRDGYVPETFGTHGFLHRKWIETVGYFVPPYFSSDYNDTWLNDVSILIDRHVFIPELYTEHMHPVNGKADWDTTHQERLARGTRDGVSRVYEEKLDERKRDAEKLNSYIKQCK